MAYTANLGAKANHYSFPLLPNQAAIPASLKNYPILMPKQPVFSLPHTLIPNPLFPHLSPLSLKITEETWSVSASRESRKYQNNIINTLLCSILSYSRSVHGRRRLRIAPWCMAYGGGVVDGRGAGGVW